MNVARSLCLSLAFAVLAGGAGAQNGAYGTADPNEGKAGVPADSLFRQWRAAVEAQSREPLRSGGGIDTGPAGAFGATEPMMMSMETMGMGMEMPMTEPPPTPGELFQQAISQSVQQLKTAKTDAEKRELLDLVHAALNERYERAIAQRQQDLDELEKRLQQLRTDLERRRESQKKVVDVQLQTLELAGEGLVEAGASQ